MKRLNPSTGLPFKRGDMREDGYTFINYRTTKIKKDGYFVEHWQNISSYNNIKTFDSQRNLKRRIKIMSTKEGHILTQLNAIRHRSKINNIPFNLTLEYLVNIAPNTCPVFGVKLLWAKQNKTIKSNSPSLDKINPKLGYVIGNVQWLSNKANVMKHNANGKELKQFAQWVLSQQL